MRAYLEAMAAAEVAVKAPARNVVLAALGPKMLALAAEKTNGRIALQRHAGAYAEAKRSSVADRWLCVEQKICLTTDAAAARKVAAEQLSRYMRLPNYRNNWLRLGFSERNCRAAATIDSSTPWSPGATRRRSVPGSRHMSTLAPRMSASSRSTRTGTDAGLEGAGGAGAGGITAGRRFARCGRSGDHGGTGKDGPWLSSFASCTRYTAWRSSALTWPSPSTTRPSPGSAPRWTSIRCCCSAAST